MESFDEVSGDRMVEFEVVLSWSLWGLGASQLNSNGFIVHIIMTIIPCKLLVLQVSN